MQRAQRFLRQYAGRSRVECLPGPDAKGQGYFHGLAEYVGGHKAFVALVDWQILAVDGERA